MNVYYTAVMLLVVFAMICMEACVVTSSALTRENKKLFFFLFTSIIVAGGCEWLGVMLSGTGRETRALHRFITAVEFSVAPAIGFIMAWIIGEKRIREGMIFLIVHAAIEFALCPFGGIFAIDKASNYSRGPMHFVYIAVYAVSIVIIVVNIVKQTRKHQYGGMTFFVLMMLFLVTGVVIQIARVDWKAVYLTIGMASIMLYIFTFEMLQQVDKLTGLLNRLGWENKLAHAEEPGIVLVLDVDGFKRVNDRYGHVFGDEVLREVGKMLLDTYSGSGKCYRVGGDEFCVFLEKNTEDVEWFNRMLQEALNERKREDPRFPSVSVGYVPYDPESMTFNDAVNDADEEMYRNKSARKATRLEQ